MTLRLCLLFLLGALLAIPPGAAAQAATATPGAWGDQGGGAYANPILPGDFQNPDVVRVGADYYGIVATKALSPGMAVLHSRDLVNWASLGHVIPDITQFSPRFNYARMEGQEQGVWAGAIACHQRRFYVYFTTPDEGIYVSTAASPAGPWGPLTCLMKAGGWDDPCPFWDDDGQAYLVTTHFARDPINGKTYNIHLFKMAPDGQSLLTASDTIIHQSPGSEANKLFKVSGYYYHFYSEVTGEGRVPMIERARTITGPYESRQLMHVNAPTDGEPNQGTILQTGRGAWVFLTHHGIGGWEGRPVSLLPVVWKDGWPVPGRIGSDGIGNMLWTGKKPINGFPAVTLQANDEFDGPKLSPQWEWYFQPRADKWSLTAHPGSLRLYAFMPLAPGDLRKTGNILTQRPLRAEGSLAVVRMDITHMADGQEAGLCFLGGTSTALVVSQAQGTRRIGRSDNGKLLLGPAIPDGVHTLWLRATWGVTGDVAFQFSTDGAVFTLFGTAFRITSLGSHLGARIGIFTVNNTQEAGYVDVQSFHYADTHRLSHKAKA